MFPASEFVGVKVSIVCNHATGGEKKKIVLMEIETLLAEQKTYQLRSRNSIKIIKVLSLIVQVSVVKKGKKKIVQVSVV